MNNKKKNKVNKRWNFILYVFLYCNIQSRTISNNTLSYEVEPILERRQNRTNSMGTNSKTTSMLLTFPSLATHANLWVVFGFPILGFTHLYFDKGIGNRHPFESARWEQHISDMFYDFSSFLFNFEKKKIHNFICDLTTTKRNTLHSSFPVSVCDRECGGVQQNNNYNTL